MQRAGFTLIELTIAVAIVGILAAIAIPSFVETTLKAKRAELPANLAGIRAAEAAWQVAYDTFLTTDANPVGTPTREVRAWATADDWTRLGWRPDGPVRAAYRVDASAGSDYTAFAVSDLDGNGELLVYSATRESDATFASGDEHVF